MFTDQTVILACLLVFQTLLDPRQIRNANQVRPDFFSVCFNGTTTYIGIVGGTQMTAHQIRNYGLWIDGQTLNLWRPSGGLLSITMRSAVSGSIELRYGMQNPQFNLVGFRFADVTIVGNGGWAMGPLRANELNHYSGPPLASVAILKGAFGPITTYPAKSACDGFRDVGNWRTDPLPAGMSPVQDAYVVLVSSFNDR